MNDQKSPSIVGQAAAVKDMLGLIAKVAPTQSNVLIIGESGTGKELVARLIHDSGPLKSKPFIPVNCGAIPETLIESEMFGHKKGSFTGAHADKMGLFEAANGGTLFLDEVGELPLSMQVKLLRAIQERCFRKLGGVEDIKVNLRIIAATNRDLEQGIAQGTFREDLYYRLNVILIKTPPLRARRGDIPMLAEHFLKNSRSNAGKQIQGFHPEAMELLKAHPWPGNIRELQNVIERAVALEPGKRISRSSLPPEFLEAKPAGASADAPIASASPGSSSPGQAAELKIPLPDFNQKPVNLDEILGEVEKVFLEKALAHSGGVKKKAADLLGITFRSMRYRLKKLGVEDSGDEDGAE